jgi:hypothetical protein
MMGVVLTIACGIGEPEANFEFHNTVSMEHSGGGGVVITV